MSDFVADVKRWTEKVENRANSIIEGSVAEIFKRIVTNTPVDVDSTKHRGKTKGNWRLGKDSAANDILDFSDTSPTGDATVARELAKLDGTLPNQCYYIYNNEGNSKMLEFGLYRKTSTSPKTINGFSTQAPSGMVRIVLEEFSDIVKKKIGEEVT